jgi:hypothetical protein
MGVIAVESISVEHSPTLAAARARFLSDLGDWVRACLATIRPESPLDGHDQGTFTVAWAPHIAETGDRQALRFMTELRDHARARFIAKGRWKHGYWTMNEAHHGTEHFELFLATLWRLNPQDGETVRQFTDAAEHLGNWSPEVPPWFEWKTGLFRSMYFGAEGIREEPGDVLNVPDHLRCVSLALIALDMTGDRRHADLARAHAALWAEAIIKGRELPVGLLPDGPVYHLTPGFEKTYRTFAGMAGALDDAVERAENLLASGAVNVLLRMWTLTRENRYREAAERLLNVIATQLGDPDAGAAADAVRLYRRLTGDTRFDAQVQAAVAGLDPSGIRQLSIEPTVQRTKRPCGIGKRSDMPNWLEDGRPRRHNPILLAVAAEMTGNEPLAIGAVDLARTYFALARRVYPSGREHGCSARSVSAIARGHGRENNAGVVTGVLQQL